MNKQPHPRRAAKYMKTLLKAFQLFFRDDIINKVVLYTNAFIQPLIESISVVFEISDKHPHFLIVGYINIWVYFETFYLRATFRMNLLRSSAIWNHEISYDFFLAAVSENLEIYQSLLTPLRTNYLELNAERMTSFHAWVNWLR